MDQDNDNRLFLDDFVRCISMLNQWGGKFNDVKAVKAAFRKYDDNDGNIILFDEFINFAEDYKLDIEKDVDIIKMYSLPRKVYKKHEFMRAGQKRPNKIDPELWHAKQPKNLDEEIEDIIKTRSRSYLKSGSKRPANLNKSVMGKPDTGSPKKVNFIK